MCRPLAFFAFALLLCPAAPALAQQPAQPWGSWLIGTVQLPGTSERRWGGFAEAQVRTNRVLRQYFYHELKAGLSYDLDKNFTVLLGGGRYATSDYRALDAGPLNVERRLWQQLVLSQYMSRLRVEHRYRVEQRWFRHRPDSSSFRGRLRYRLNAFLPLNHPTISNNTVFLSVYDELFINPTGPLLERNRLYVGVGYQFNARLTLQTGWLHQANYSQRPLPAAQIGPQNAPRKSNVVLSMVYRLNTHKATAAPEHLPTQQD
ncbi:Protein of unknown function [Hymenobacter daecheongensis DSM 21074]|uniref:DUF2490 domain-containing protein n=1 Tax=Hymenobacter daecheongensis DSM 21074 TaxID=1121955 RepID=A0A1M6EVA9_9BACT|nr:DUF2490 domain-containing protein [Hymenobacter daecheongensis]SHI89352.1 Protein of unknown function [Hymenobacter daecheongensis DSM 21074]